MADISKITLPSGSTYNFKDAQARSDIAAIQTAVTGGVSFLGITSTELSDGASTATITINSESVSAINGGMVIYGDDEFVYSSYDSKWHRFGPAGTFKALAFKDNASATYTPAGTVTQPTFSGSELTSTGTASPSGSVSVSLSSANSTSSGAVSYISAIGTKEFSGTQATIKPKVTAAGDVTISTGSGTANYTPAGSVSTPTISVSSAGATTTVNSITDVGSLPSFSATVSNENLTLSFDAGALPTKGSNTTVKTGDATYTASQPSFTGTGANLVASFVGTEVEGTATYTPAGTVTVDSTTKYLTGSGTFSGDSLSISVTGTPSGTVSQPTFSGTQATITVS